MNIRKLLKRYNHDLDLYFEAIDRKKEHAARIIETIKDTITRVMILTIIFIPIGLINTLLENYR